MKTSGIACVLALGLTGSTAARGQTPAGATVTERESASALASSDTAIECDDGSTATLETSIVLASSLESVRSTTASSQAASLTLDWFEFNPCTGQLRHTARIIDAPDSDHDGLRGAAVIGSFELADATVPVGTVNIDVQWSGTGPVTRTNAHDTTETNGATIITVSQEARRAADLSGTITLSGIELALSSPGELVTTRTLELTLPR